MDGHVYRVLVKNDDGEWVPWTKNRRATTRLYERLGIARSAVGQLKFENRCRERRGLAPIEYRVEQSELNWEPVDG